MPDNNPHPTIIRNDGETYWLIDYDIDGYHTLQHVESGDLHAIYLEDPGYDNIVSQIESQRIWHAIQRERAYQDRKYGTPDQRMLWIADYIQIIRNELNEVEKALAEGNPEHALCEMLQATTVGVACIEFHGLIERPENKE
jgi:hypothetical protein